MDTIIITGGSGLIGTALTHFLLEKKYRVRHLGRTKRGRNNIEEFIWNPEKQEIDVDALNGVDLIIHLAGTNIGKGTWTDDRKKEIIESRVQSTKLLFETIQKNNCNPQKIICASAIGYYGIIGKSSYYTEEDNPGNDFMAEVCIAWEDEITKQNKAQIPTSIFRIGVVLTNKGGALPLMAKPVSLFAGAPIGNGNQLISWIHINDLCKMFLWSIENKEITGVFNAVAPNPVSNKKFTETLGIILKRPVWPIHIPSFILKTMLGEQSEIVLQGVGVSSKKIEAEGFNFEFPEIKNALKNLLA
jgi:hypothetical protein